MKSILAGQCKVLSYNSEEVNSQDKTDGSLSTPVENLLSSQESSNKTRLISRIAKLGQPILPLNGVTAADQSDSDQVPVSVLQLKNMLSSSFYILPFCSIQDS